MVCTSICGRPACLGRWDVFPRPRRGVKLATNRLSENVSGYLDDEGNNPKVSMTNCYWS